MKILIRTAMLESRYIWGDWKLFNELRRRFYSEVADDTGPEFVEEKLAERDTRHERWAVRVTCSNQISRKAKKGLRDLQTLYWIAKYLYKVDEVANVVDGVLTKKKRTVLTGPAVSLGCPLPTALSRRLARIA